VQIFEVVSGKQIFEISMPGCESIFFLDNERLLIIRDEHSNVYVCSIESQKKAFQEKVLIMKPQVDEIKTIKLEATTDYDGLGTAVANMFGLRNQPKIKRSDSAELNLDEEQDSAGVKVIVSSFQPNLAYSDLMRISETCSVVPTRGLWVT
jgi:hypothetical protein